MITIRVATRKSPLAMAQTAEAADRLATVRPDCRVDAVGMLSEGDMRSGTLAGAGSKDLFVRELRRAQLAGRADAACHSLKDIGEDPADFIVAAYMRRRDARDALVGRTLHQLRGMRSPRLGTSSPRRTAMFAALLPAARIMPLRGNVGTRLTKLDGGKFDAIVLACAGLERLGLADRISERLDADSFLPAPGQGITVLECRASERRTADLLAAIDDPLARSAGIAERSCARATEGNCFTPLGAHATRRTDGGWEVSCELLMPDGSAKATGRAVDGDPARAGALAAQRMLAGTGAQLLAAIRNGSPG